MAATLDFTVLPTNIFPFFTFEYSNKYSYVPLEPVALQPILAQGNKT